MIVSKPLQPPLGTSVAHAARRSGHAAANAVASHWVRRLMRFGYVVRGIIYLLPAVLALRLAVFTGGGNSPSLTQPGAIVTIGRQPMGQVMLVVIAVGLAGYALWGMTRALLDPLQRGNSSGGIFKRLGYAWSGLVHVGLFVVTLRLIIDSRSKITTDQGWIADLLAKPWGAWLVGIIGVVWIVGGGVGQIVAGWKGSIEKDLDLAGRHPAERWWAVRLGRAGIVSRGIVFTIVGMFLITAAWHARAEEARGVDGALLEVLGQPYGRILLTLLSVGLIAFGLFSVLCARWMRITPTTPGSHRPNVSHSHLRDSS